MKNQVEDRFGLGGGGGGMLEVDFTENIRKIIFEKPKKLGEI